MMQGSQSIPPDIPVVEESKMGRDGKPSRTCLVRGCEHDLANDKIYYQRQNICEKHVKAERLLMNNQVVRFCQQCARFHPITEFEGLKRSCRERLESHNKRRKQPAKRANGRASPLPHDPAHPPYKTKKLNNGQQQGQAHGVTIPTTLPQHMTHRPMTYMHMPNGHTQPERALTPATAAHHHPPIITGAGNADYSHAPQAASPGAYRNAHLPGVTTMATGAPPAPVRAAGAPASQWSQYAQPDPQGLMPTDHYASIMTSPQVEVSTAPSSAIQRAVGGSFGMAQVATEVGAGSVGLGEGDGDKTGVGTSQSLLLDNSQSFDIGRLLNSLGSTLSTEKISELQLVASSQGLKDVIAAVDAASQPLAAGSQQPGEAGAPDGGAGQVVQIGEQAQNILDQLMHQYQVQHQAPQGQDAQSTQQRQMNLLSELQRIANTQAPGDAAAGATGAPGDTVVAAGPGPRVSGPTTLMADLVTGVTGMTGLSGLPSDLLGGQPSEAFPDSLLRGAGLPQLPPELAAGQAPPPAGYQPAVGGEAAAPGVDNRYEAQLRQHLQRLTALTRGDLEVGVTDTAKALQRQREGLGMVHDSLCFLFDHIDWTERQQEQQLYNMLRQGLFGVANKLEELAGSVSHVAAKVDPAMGRMGHVQDARGQELVKHEAPV